MNLMSLKIIRITLMLSLPTLAACSGGGGGGSGSSTTDTAALSFQPLVGTGIDHAVMEIYNKDLNGDGIDEVIFAGRKTQPSTSADWRNFNIQIFGWNNSSTLANETSTWFSGTDNIIIGTDQAVKFGDFDGDGRVDMITTSATDDSTRSIYGQTVVYHQNTAGAFTRSVVTTQADALWSHDLAVYDFNNDGRMDFLASDYGSKATMGFGNADDTFTLHVTTYGASGYAVADFISTNGTQYGRASVEIVASDSGSSGTSTDDTRMFTWSVVDPAVAGTLTLTDTGKAFPTTTSPNDHSVRVLAFDFNAAGGTDIIVFSRSLDQSGTSVVEFIANDGAGNFTTAAAVSNFTGNELGANYQPILISIDGTGNADIFLTGTDFNGSYDSTQVLVNNDDGTFTGTYVSNFAANWNAKKALTTDANPSGMTQQIVKGPSNNYYIVTSVYYDVYEAGVGTKNSAVYTTNIGATISTGLTNI